MSLLFLILFLVLQVQPTHEDQKLDTLFEDYWEYTLQSSPLFATSQGEHHLNDQLPGSDLEAIGERHNQTLAFKERMGQIRREELSEENRLNYDIFDRQLENSIRGFELKTHLLPLNGWWDYHATFADLPNRVPLRTIEDYENYLNRLSDFREYNSGYIERMQKGMEMGMVRPKIVFDDYPESVSSLIREDLKESLLYAPFLEMPDRFSEEDSKKLQEKAERIITTIVNPELERLYTFLLEEYIPASSDYTGITGIPNGEEYYNFLIENYTTLSVTADEVYETGLAEVARIRNEMMAIVEQQGYGNDFDAFVGYLRTDPEFYAETPEELMKETAYILKKMDGKLPELFKTLPRLPYGIIEIPDHLAPRTATAYYSRGAADGTRAGNYAVNTYNLQSRPLYEVTALSLHEAVPGHHLQIALQQELEDLPKFRTIAGFTAYTEGWALYSERLGLEVGMYDDPYQNFGRLSYEMWRALRLVVDTGIHAKGWTREEAVDYMAKNSALSLHNIRSEVNRYIFWPGQALAYKMGEIKIRELRALAEEELGEDFDLREFHDVVLLSGAVPLSVLEDSIKSYIEEFRNH